MPDLEKPMTYIVATLVAALVYFLNDAHRGIKIGIDQRATQKALDETKAEWRNDLREIEDRHQRETSRLEQRSEQTVAAVVRQFQGRMDGMERNIQARMDLILELLKQRAP